MGSEVQDREFARHVESRNSTLELDARLLEHAGLANVSCTRPRDPRHRAADVRPLDWTAEHPDIWVCGICHPPPAGADVIPRKP